MFNGCIKNDCQKTFEKLYNKSISLCIQIRLFLQQIWAYELYLNNSAHTEYILYKYNY